MADESDRTVHLLDAWYEGDRRALTELLVEHMTWMRRRVARELRGRERARMDSVDIVQEGVIRLLKRGPAYAPRNRAQFRALLAKVLRSAHRDEVARMHALRRDAGREERLPSAHLSHVGPSAGSQAGPGTVLDRRDMQDRVRRSLASLDASDRELILLRQHQDLPFEVVAERLGIGTPDAARMRFNRALKKLAQALLETRRTDRDEPAP